MSRKKRIVFAIADVAGGHRATARALQHEFDTRYADQCTTEIVDFFAATDVPPFNTSNLSYELFSRNDTLQFLNNATFRAVNSELLYPLFANYVTARLYYPALHLISHLQPDIVIGNHPILQIVIKALKQRAGGFKSVVQVNDIGTILRGYADDSADLVFAPTPSTRQTLIDYGVQSDRVLAPYFAVEPKFAKLTPVKTMRQQLNIVSARPVVLITGGGLNGRSMLKGIDALAQTESYELVIMTGNNQAFREEVEKRYRQRGNVHVVGYVNNMQDYYHLADVVVAKPGPSTIMELAILGKRAVFTREVGEQEHGNIQFALQSPQFRAAGSRWAQLPQLVEALLQEKLNEQDSLHRSLQETRAMADTIVERLF